MIRKQKIGANLEKDAIIGVSLCFCAHHVVEADKCERASELNLDT